MEAVVIIDENNDTDDLLQEYFKHIIHSKKLEVETSDLNSVLKSLGINFNLLDPTLKYALPYMLVHFIKTWPGWKRTSNYYNKQISFEKWFSRFKEYLVYKINFLIKNDYNNALATLCSSTSSSNDKENATVKKVDTAVQTNLSTEKDFAPFSLDISGPAKILNSLIFVEGSDDSVIVKEYHVNSTWESLNVRQLINWPCTEVEFKSEHLHFKRCTMHNFERHLSFNSGKLLQLKQTETVEEIEIIDENIERQAYTLNALKEYCKTYIHVLRNKPADCPEGFMKEIEIILEDFILDIVDINKNSMATNTKVLLSVGNTVYARNKALRSKDISLCERITPKLSLSLFSFTAINDPNITNFGHIFSSEDIDKLLPTITYGCNFCSISNLKYSELFDHYQATHILEQPVICFKCKTQLKIQHLTDNRWFHNCKDSNKKS